MGGCTNGTAAMRYGICASRQKHCSSSGHGQTAILCFSIFQGQWGREVILMGGQRFCLPLTIIQSPFLYSDGIGLFWLVGFTR